MNRPSDFTCCLTCKFWLSTGELDPTDGYNRLGDLYGECRCLTPSIEEATGSGIWPETHASDFCGKYKARDDHCYGIGESHTDWQVGAIRGDDGFEPGIEVNPPISPRPPEN